MSVQLAAQAAYLVAAVLFILALAGLSHHETARAGNTFGIAGMVVALAATVALAVHGHISGAGLATLAQFAGAWYAAGAHPLPRYLEDLTDEDASTGDVVNAVIERRVFAVPLPAGRVDGLAEESDGSRREASELDAAVSGDRTLITVMEASARGVPQQRFPSFVTVAQQLWDGDPLEVWQAARRLRDAGRSRDWVLDRLARTWDAQGGDDEK